MCKDLETSAPPIREGYPNGVPRRKQQSDFEFLRPKEPQAPGKNRAKVRQASTTAEDESQMQLPQRSENIFRTRIDSHREKPERQEGPFAALFRNRPRGRSFLGNCSHRQRDCFAHSFGGM